jgi:hypothetical protein
MRPRLEPLHRRNPPILRASATVAVPRRREPAVTFDEIR